MTDPGPSSALPRRLLPPVVALLAALPVLSFRPDDLYIYLRMVANVLAGRAWGFNPGEAVNVASSPGWFLVLLGLGAAGAGGAAAAQVASAFCWALAVRAVDRLGELLAGDPRVGLAAGLAVAADAWTSRWLYSGMETGLAVAVVAWAAVLRLGSPPGSRADRASGVLLALAPLVRPELVVVSLAALAVDLAGGERRRALRDGAFLALVGALWAAFSLATWGSVVPQTMVAKGSLGARNIGAVAAAGRVLLVIASTQGIALLLAAATAVAWGRGGPGARRKAARWFALALGLALLAYAARHVRVYTRYVLPLGVPLVALGFAGLATWTRERGRRGGLVLGLALAATLAANAFLAGVRVIPRTRAYARSMATFVLPLAERIDRELPPDAVVAAPNIGVLGYVGKRRILDLNGLATPAIVPYKREGRVPEYLAAHPPDLLVEIGPEPARWGDDPAFPLALEETDRFPFRGMFVSGPEVTWWTVYRVRGVRGPRRAGPGGA